MPFRPTAPRASRSAMWWRNCRPSRRESRGWCSAVFPRPRRSIISKPSPKWGSAEESYLRPNWPRRIGPRAKAGRSKSMTFIAQRIAALLFALLVIIPAAAQEVRTSSDALLDEIREHVRKEFYDRSAVPALEQALDRHRGKA